MRIIALFVGYYILVGVFMFFLDNTERSLLRLLIESAVLAAVISAVDIYLFGRLKDKSGKK